MIACAPGDSSEAGDEVRGEDAPAKARTAATERAIESPVTYSGEIPSAHGPGERVTVTLFPDGTFRLRHVFLGVADGEDKVFHDLGRWDRAEAGDRLILRGGTEAPHQFAYDKDGRMIRVLDDDGREISSGAYYDLPRQAEVDRIEGPIPLKGMYAYMADAAALTECLTGKPFPVLIEADHIALERAYMNTPHEPGEMVLVTLSGRFVERAPEPGLPPREHIRVEAFDRVWPGETCPSAGPANATLVNTYWKAVEILGEGVSLAEGQKEPYILLAVNENRVRGFTGCNELTGSYELELDGLRFGPLATTRKACPPPAMEMEKAFLEGMEAVVAYRIEGERLTLLGAGDAVVMRLEAVYFE